MVGGFTLLMSSPHVPLHLRIRHLVLTPETQQQIHHRLRAALSRFGDRIRRITVRLEDVNGPKGGVDLACRVQVDLRDRESVFIEDREATLQRLVDRVADRVSEAMARRADRRRFGRDSIRSLRVVS